MERQSIESTREPQEVEVQTETSNDGDSAGAAAEDGGVGADQALQPELIQQSPENAGMGGRLRALGRLVLWPLRRFFDPRFGGMSTQISAEAHDTRTHIAALVADQHHVQLREQEAMLMDLRRIVIADMDAAVEASTVVGEALRDLQELVEQPQSGGTRAYLKRLSAGDISDLDPDVARLLNYAASHEGFAAQSKLWFNWALSLEHKSDGVHLADVNERIVELPYAIRATAGLEPGSRVLDIGAAESTLPLYLASLGFEVVALDPRSYPIVHPNLRVEAQPLEDWDTDETFAAILCISTIEHIGSGEYGQQPRAEGAATALSRIRELTDPGGLLVLTTPLGSSNSESGARVYSRRELEELLADWEIVDFTVVGQQDATTWAPGPAKTVPAQSVALITARRPE
jgi:2-polyprenyl-3-methyl-5-hydroxy-6-metoxy-1,4-benzoquinol methylase